MKEWFIIWIRASWISKQQYLFTSILLDFYFFYIVDNWIYNEIFIATQHSVALPHKIVWSWTRARSPITMLQAPFPELRTSDSSRTHSGLLGKVLSAALMAKRRRQNEVRSLKDLYNGFHFRKNIWRAYNLVLWKDCLYSAGVSHLVACSMDMRFKMMHHSVPSA